MFIACHVNIMNTQLKLNNGLKKDNTYFKFVGMHNEPEVQQVQQERNPTGEWRTLLVFFIPVSRFHKLNFTVQPHNLDCFGI